MTNNQNVPTVTMQQEEVSSNHYQGQEVPSYQPLDAPYLLNTQSPNSVLDCRPFPATPFYNHTTTTIINNTSTTTEETSYFPRPLPQRLTLQPRKSSAAQRLLGKEDTTAQAVSTSHEDCIAVFPHPKEYSTGEWWSLPEAILLPEL